MTIIGIDPSFRKGGFAVCIMDKARAKFITYKTVAHFINEWIKIGAFSMSSDRQEIFVIENSNLQNMTFSNKGNRSVQNRISRNVGTNQAASQIVVDCLRIHFKNVYEFSPKDKGRKLTDIEFMSIIKQNKIELIDYRGTQDERDAYKLTDMGKYLHKISSARRAALKEQNNPT